MIEVSTNWIKINRSILTNRFWQEEPFTRGQAWVDLLLIANYEDGFIRVRGTRIDVKRGQVGWSQERLASRWKWSRGKVSRFLLELEENEHQIEQHKNSLSSLITIVNYELYQSSERQNGRQTDGRRTADGRQTDTKKKKEEGKEEKKEPKDIPPDGVSETVWIDFKTLRQKKKAPITQTAINGIMREAEKAGVTLDEALSICCTSGWQSFKAEWHKKPTEQNMADHRKYL